MYLVRGGRAVVTTRPDHRLSHGIDKVLRCTGCLIDVGLDGRCCAVTTTTSSAAVGGRHGDRSFVVICK